MPIYIALGFAPFFFLIGLMQGSMLDVLFVRNKLLREFAMMRFVRAIFKVMTGMVLGLGLSTLTGSNIPAILFPLATIWAVYTLRKEFHDNDIATTGRDIWAIFTTISMFATMILQ